MRKPRELSGALVRPKSLTEMVLDELRSRIVSGAFQLGMALSENVLAAELGISKTPVREALLRLKLEGLVDIQPQRGTFVFQLDARQVTQIGELRETLEVQALQLALQRNRMALVQALGECFREMRAAYAAGDTEAYRRTDARFHDCIIEHSGNEFFRIAYGLIGFRVQALRGRLTRETLLNDASFREHEAILEGIRADDFTGARRLLVRHIENTRQTYLQVLAGAPPQPPQPLRRRGKARPHARR